MEVQYVSRQNSVREKFSLTQIQSETNTVQDTKFSAKNKNFQWSEKNSQNEFGVRLNSFLSRVVLEINYYNTY